MDGIKYSRQFAEMERLVSDYFHCHLAPVMSKTQTFLTKKQGEEMREYSTSLGSYNGMIFYSTLITRFAQSPACFALPLHSRPACHPI